MSAPTFTAASTRGWSSRCRHCNESSPAMQSVNGVTRWQADHVCNPNTLAARVLEIARVIYDRLPCDDVELVMQRQNDAVVEAAQWIDTRRAAA